MTDDHPLTFPEKVAKSSQVRFVQYDPHARQLHVVFKRTPALYVYSDFGPDAWTALQQAESIGSHLHHHVTRPIDGALPYQFEKRPLPKELEE